MNILDELEAKKETKDRVSYSIKRKNSERLKELAKEKGLSQSEIVDAVLEDFFKELEE